jgi:hypothetical protein
MLTGRGRLATCAALLRLDEARARLQGAASAAHPPLPRAVRAYYARQQRLLDTVRAATVCHHDPPCRSAVAAGALGVAAPPPGRPGLLCITSNRRATRLSLGTNIALTLVKVAALALTGSVSVLSSLVDSALDLFSGAEVGCRCMHVITLRINVSAGVVLVCTGRFMRRHNHWAYPTGKTRYEPLATLIIAAGALGVLHVCSMRFSLLTHFWGAVMATAAIEIVIQAVQTLARGAADPTSSTTSMVTAGVIV